MGNAHNSRIRGVALMTLCLVIIFNPNVKIIDIFPDFIAYFIISRILRDLPLKVPYFAEFKSSITKLLTLSIIRIPAQMTSSFIKGKNTLDGDINVLMTLVFSVAEAFLLCVAITNLFNALFYLGERTKLSATIKPFSVSKDKKMSPEHLRTLCYIFAVAKCALTFIPETFLLSIDTMLSTTDVRRSIRAAYPYSITVAVVSVLVIGIILIIYSRRYAASILSSGSFSVAADTLVTNEIAIRIEQQRAFKKTSTALTLMTIASFLTFEVCFSDLNNVNLLPHFLFPIILLLGFHFLTKEHKKFLSVKISGILYTVAALAAYVDSIVFFSDFSLADIASKQTARSAYAVYIAFSTIEFILLFVFLLAFSFAMRNYVINNTGILPSASNYSKSDKEFHVALSKKGFAFSVIGILLGALKLIDVILNYNLKYSYVGTGDLSLGTVFMTSLPWLGLVITIVAAIFAGYTYYYFGLLKDDAARKFEAE